jgi:hypothetical protein
MRCQFKKPFQMYNAGDVAVFDDGTGERLLAGGFVVDLAALGAKSLDAPPVDKALEKPVKKKGMW